MLAPTSAEAAIIKWKAAVSGSWHDESKWDLGRTPVATDDVYINFTNGTTSYTVSTDTSVAVNTLTIGTTNTGATQTLNISGPNFSIANTSNINISGRINHNGNFSGNGNLSVKGLFAWQNGTLSGAGLVVVQPEGTVELTPYYFSATPLSLRRRILNYGTVRLGDGTSSAQVAIMMGSSNLSNFTNNGTVELKSNGRFTWDREGTQPTFLNSGVLRKLSSTGRTEFENVRFDTSSASTVDVQSGDLRIGGGGKTVNAGTTAGQIPFKIATRSNIEFSSNYVIDVPSTFSGNGRMHVSSGIITASAEVNVENFDISSGAISGGGVFRILKNMEWVGGTMTGTGVTTIGTDALLIFTNEASKTLNRTIYNAGTAIWTQVGALNMNAGAIFNNQPGAVFDVQQDVTFLAAAGTSPVFNNYGTLRQPPSSTGSTSQTKFAKVKVNNSGIIEWRSGTLDLGPAFIQTAGRTSLLGGNLAATDIDTTGTATNFIRYTTTFRGGILDGVGQVNSHVHNSGSRIKPGNSPGTIEIVGNYTQTPSGILDMEIAGLIPGEQFDRLIVGGLAQLAGTLNVTRLDGFVPTVGTSFELIQAAAGLSGRFNTLSGMTVGSGRYLVPSYGESIFAVGTLLDAAVPTVAVTSPINGLTYPGDGRPALVTATGTASDSASGVAGVTVAIAQFATADQNALPTAYWNWTTKTFTSPFNAALHENSANGTTSWNIATPVLPGGQYGVRATATDGADNQGLSTWARFSVPATFFSISGRITNSEGEGMAGLQITRNGASPVTTDANGNYTFNDIGAGTYTLAPVLTPGLAGAVFSPASRVANVTTANITEQNFTVLFSITGKVNNSLGVGMPNIQVKRTFNNATTTVTTDANGNYSFAAQNSGTHTIAPNPTAATTGFTFSPASFNVVVDKANIANQNFTVWFSVSGKVSNSLGVGLPNIQIKRTAGGSTVTTSTLADGTYSFKDVRSGAYTLAPNITPSMSGMTFSPSSIAINVGTVNLTNQNLTIWFSISGTVKNSSGVPQANVLVTRSTNTSSTSVLTDANGVYTFKDVRSGDYTITPSGVGFTPVSKSVTVATVNLTNINFTKP